MKLFCNFSPLSFVKTQTWEGKFANNSKEVIFIIKQCQKKTLNPKPSVPICTQSASAMYRNENLYGSFLTFLHTYIVHTYTVFHLTLPETKRKKGHVIDTFWL